MVVLKPQSKMGHAPPPQTPYSIISNIPGWERLRTIRDGDISAFTEAVHFYPRLAPTQFVRVLSERIARHLGLEGHGCLLYLNPMMWQYTAHHVTREQRGDDAIRPDELIFKVVDVASHRLYVILYEVQHTMAIRLSWRNPGVGVSIRGAEQLLNGVDSMAELLCDIQTPPPPTWTREGSAHDGLRQRIAQLLRHGATDPDKIQSGAEDVFLFPSGMAAFFRTKNLLQDYMPGSSIELGAVFRHTHELLIEDSPLGWKNFGQVDRVAIDAMDSWLQEETWHGRKTSFAIVEVPGNPSLETVDLGHLKQLSEKYGFVLIVDDTIGGFGNIDVIAYSDILLTSLSKSFSGKANVLGGSIVLNPRSAHYNELSDRFARAHGNELFEADAKILLDNSADFFPRTMRLNNNAKAMADFLHNAISLPISPITKVHYPPFLPSRPEYDAVRRRSTDHLPEPGYGCLLTVDFETLGMAKAFYDRCGFYPSPHLAGHVTIMLAYNMYAFGKTVGERAKYREMGLKEESVRISAGLENVNDLIDTLGDALDAAIQAKKETTVHGHERRF